MCARRLLVCNCWTSVGKLQVSFICSQKFSEVFLQVRKHKTNKLICDDFVIRMRAWAVERVTLSKPLVCVLFLFHKWFHAGKLEIWLGWTGHFQFILFLDSCQKVSLTYLSSSDHNVSESPNSENMQILGSGCIHKSCCRPPLPYIDFFLPMWIT